MFPCPSLTEECVEGVVTIPDGLVTGHLSIRLDSMLQAVQLPTSITDLTTGLSDVDRDTLTHFEFWLTFLDLNYRMIFCILSF
jgi:hypothetical protein